MVPRAENFPGLARVSPAGTVAGLVPNPAMIAVAREATPGEMVIEWLAGELNMTILSATKQVALPALPERETTPWTSRRGC